MIELQKTVQNLVVTMSNKNKLPNELVVIHGTIKCSSNMLRVYSEAMEQYRSEHSQHRKVELDERAFVIPTDFGLDQHKNSGLVDQDYPHIHIDHTDDSSESF